MTHKAHFNINLKRNLVNEHVIMNKNSVPESVTIERFNCNSIH